MAAAKLPPATTVVRVPPTVLTAASTPWPTILLGVAVVVAICLWLLFRPGSIGHRARTDHPDDEITGTDETDQSPSGGR
jgi:hypothetical protein